MIFMEGLLFYKMLMVNLGLRSQWFKVCYWHLKLSFCLSSNMNLFIPIVMHDEFVMIACILIFFWSLWVIYYNHSIILSSIVESSVLSRFFIFIQLLLGLKMTLCRPWLILCSILLIGRYKDLHHLIYKMRQSGLFINRFNVFNQILIGHMLLFEFSLGISKLLKLS